MHLTGGRLILSASDLTGFLECPHLTQQELAATRGAIARPERDDLELALIARHGDEHEAAHLASYVAAGKTVAGIETWSATLEAYWKAREQTLEAMRSGADVIYQACLFDGRWLGYADFLERTEDGGYEVVDTKLARSAKAAALLQTSLYSELLAPMQGREPKSMHLVLGDGTRQSFRVGDSRAYLHHAKGRLESIAAAAPAATYPEPVEHCGVCRWHDVCERRWRDDDSLVLVAGLSRSQARKLGASGVTTVAALASANGDLSATGIGASTLARLRKQAELQVLERDTGKPAYELIPPERPELGLALLPQPDQADLVFDMESDPWALDGGLEYLFGILDGAGEFTPIWAHDRAQEKDAFERFIDLVIARLDAHPGMHVYHYASYEPQALKRLMGRHGTREAEVDRLLRGQVLVDLYRVVKQSLIASRESYSLKDIEALYMGRRSDQIAEAGSSIVAYEQWVDGREQSILDSIAAYNEQDCRSTWLLREWLEQCRPEAEAKFNLTIPRPSPQPSEPSVELAKWEQDIEELSARLTAAGCWLLGQQLWWHRREQRSDWWGYYERLKMTDEELIGDTESIGGLQYAGVDGPYKHSLLHRYSFPPQEHKLSVGQSPVDPRTKKSAGEVHELDIAGWIVLRRGKGSAVPHPAALIPPTPIEDRVLRDAIRRVGEWVVGHGIEGDGAYRSVRDLLVLAAPRAEDSYLAIQGPPGTGKTSLAARMVVDRLQAGRRVGVTALSHKVISHLLDSVCAEAERRGNVLRALQKAEPEQRTVSKAVESTTSNADVDDALVAGEIDLVAGTAWLFARPEIEGRLDDLFVDEAGQMSLANVIAASTCARNVVLLGDPNQLRQPSKGAHPEGADVSALDHVLAGATTMPAERGRFLEMTYRMHPDVCGFISEIAYESRLESAPECARQRVGGEGELSGTGLRFRSVVHAGNRTSSSEEAREVVEVFNALLGRRWTDRHGQERPLTADDILVVAPYNAHVALLAGKLPAGARVGTVDKFQGQEAPVVIYSMATSTPADAPRGMEFLYSLNRLNVAISRAQGMAILVCSPALLDVIARSPEQMRLANALCRLVVMAGGEETTPSRVPIDQASGSGAILSTDATA